MAGEIEFETPENIQVSYRTAGPGSRFVAWILDNILLWVVTIVVAIPALFLFGAALEVFVRNVVETDGSDLEKMNAALFIIGLFWLLFSFSGFLYFGLCELFFRGQTFGKRQLQLRVVKSNGFALDPVSILVRTLFRVVDHLPPLWVVPLFTARSQRLGDLVAGTLVISDERTESVGRRELASRGYADCRFHFDSRALGRARPQDIAAIEQVLERWGTLRPQDRDSLIERIVPPFADRLQVERPAPADALQFLEDFLAAEYRRQYRKLG